MSCGPECLECIRHKLADTEQALETARAELAEEEVYSLELSKQLETMTKAGNPLTSR